MTKKQPTKKTGLQPNVMAAIRKLNTEQARRMYELVKHPDETGYPLPGIEASELQIEVLCHMIEYGASIEDAAATADVSPNEISSWGKRADNLDDPHRKGYRALNDRVLKAKADTAVMTPKQRKQLEQILDDHARRRPHPARRGSK